MNFKKDITSSGHDRVSCTSCEKAVVRQPHMTKRDWVIAVTAFKKRHVRCHGTAGSSWTFADETRHLAEGQTIAEENVEAEIG